MKMCPHVTPKVAEAIGLWLAEGDTKTNAEITFTNNSLELIKFFGDVIKQVFSEHELNYRIYIYSATEEKIRFPRHYTLRYYKDKRARKPYCIFRVASVKVVNEWKRLAEMIKFDERYYADVLRGFFAGEGNIKEGSHSNRTIRIAQGTPNKLVEDILRYYGISYRFSARGRSYEITGRWNWKKLADIRIADLHPLKKKRFWRVFNDFKEDHYPNNKLKNSIIELLVEPQTSLDLARKFDRSQARIQDILIPLKKCGKIKTFRVGSKNYWITSKQRGVIISKVKKKYLSSLREEDKNAAKLAREFEVCWKSANGRLIELQKLNLVTKNSTGTWSTVPNQREVIVL